MIRSLILLNLTIPSLSTTFAHLLFPAFPLTISDTELKYKGCAGTHRQINKRNCSMVRVWVHYFVGSMMRVYNNIFCQLYGEMWIIIHFSSSIVIVCIVLYFAYSMVRVWIILYFASSMVRVCIIFYFASSMVRCIILYFASFMVRVCIILCFASSIVRVCIMLNFASFMASICIEYTSCVG